MTDLISVAGREIPRPEELRVLVRDLGVVVEHLPIPFPAWEQELYELKVLLLMSEAIYKDYS